ncbi:nuclear factor related to kappa-B-binding protein-like, partial [Musca vetustissima]|uniref:nuclear factor related to kappa-B-binding protein-like n=1 Tax=Musca vetustissima TaxID=27455 RepID=UPI002AB70BA9
MSDSEYSESFAGGGVAGGQDDNERRQRHQMLMQQHQQQMQQQHNLVYGNNFEMESSSSSSAGDSSVSSTSSDDDSDEENESDDSLELAKITNEVLSLPRGLCENPAIFQEFFSVETWQSLPPHMQNHLQQFLPNFHKVLPPQMAAVEQARSISMLFSGELTAFGQSPMANLQKHLEAGNYRPDIKKLRENIKKSQRRESKFQNCERLSYMAKQLFVSRQRLLEHAYKSLPESVTKAPLPSTSVSSMRQPKPGHLYHDNKLSAIRARKRFYNEISQIATELQLQDDFVLSADEENDMDNNLNEEWRKDLIQQQRSLEENAEPPKANIALAERCVYSTVFRKRSELDDEDAFRLQQRSRQSRLTNRNFKEYLREHKRRKLTEPTLPELETSDIRLRDVCARAQIGGNFKRVLGAGKPGRKPKSAANTIPSNSNQLGATEKTESSLEINSKPLPSSLPATPNNAANMNQTQPQPPTSTPPTLSSSQIATKLSEPPALVPIQQTITKKNVEIFQNSGGNMPTVSPTKTATTIQHYHQQQQQQQQLESPSAFTKTSNNHHLHNTTNDSLNMSSFMSGHSDNLNLCMDDTSILATSDHDAFNMLDNEVELQQEEVETFAGTSAGDDNLSNFVIGDDIVLGGHGNGTSSMLQSSHSHKNGNRQQQQQQPLPKLEPISIKPTIKSLNNQQKSLSSPSPGSQQQMTNVLCSSELIQETHASYFSLIRDFFCSTPNHRMRYDDLKSKIDIWLRNPITALNEWYAHAENWSNLLSSAINFLVGDFPDLPEEYVPYIEHKIQLNIYQWIGAGRDSDNRLTELCNVWMEKRKHPQEKQKSIEGKLEVLPKSVVESDETTAEAAAMIPPPPPPRFPTTWTVRPATAEEILEFQRQERERFEQPHKAYTYYMHGYESVVGPVKGIYTPMLALAKARGHSMMVGDRPNFVTILTLVRDATARLPNGEGTRADISELLKCSQYINPDAAENVLQTIVSGALDRMHTEHDPCVRYDPKRKIWIYLHRNRTEEEFERIHQQNQSMGKVKKLQQRKPRPVVATAQGTKLNSPEQETAEINGGGSGGGGTLLTLPALVPANPIIVSNHSSNPPRQPTASLTAQQKHLQQQQQIQLS